MLREKIIDGWKWFRIWWCVTLCVLGLIVVMGLAIRIGIIERRAVRNQEICPRHGYIHTAKMCPKHGVIHK